MGDIHFLSRNTQGVRTINVADDDRVVSVERMMDASAARQDTTAILWQNGKIRDLNQVIPAGLGWQLKNATGINDQGQIVGYGRINGQDHAFLLTPPAK